MKRPQTKEDLRNHLQEQLDLLSVFADLYDGGNKKIAKPMATSIRVLLYDTPKSTSLLGQLNMKGNTFFDTSPPAIDPSTEKHFGGNPGLAGIPTEGGEYTPFLDEPPPKYQKRSNFDDYWNNKVVFDSKGQDFSRKDLVLAVANKDGGAHVDTSLDEKYAQLSRENSMGWKSVSSEKDTTPIEHVELAIIRQITHEILRTYLKDYPKKKMNTKGAFAVFSGVSLVRDTAASQVATSGKKVRRNDRCPCESGLKYKKCCGR